MKQSVQWNSNLFPAAAFTLLQRLEAAGRKSYLVGGCVRDTLLGKEPHDVDITTAALPDETARLFSALRPDRHGIAYGTVGVCVEGLRYEITTFRREGGYFDNRHPTDVSFCGDVESDLIRRDFTVNSIAWSPVRGFRDPCGGLSDLEGRHLRTCGDPDARFAEDALRILRLFRFAAQLGFGICGDTLAGALRGLPGLEHVSTERKTSEWLLTLAASHTDVLGLLAKNEVWPLLLSAPDAALPLQRLGACPPDPILRLAALLRLTGHGQEAADVLCLSSRQRESLFLYRQELESPPAVSKAALKRRLSSLGADRFALTEPTRAALGLPPTDPVFLREIVANREPYLLSDLAVNGDDLLRLGCRGREVGRLLQAFLLHVTDSPEDNRRGVLLALAGRLSGGV